MTYTTLSLAKHSVFHYNKVKCFGKILTEIYDEYMENIWTLIDSVRKHMQLSIAYGTFQYGFHGNQELNIMNFDYFTTRTAKTKENASIYELVLRHWQCGLGAIFL